MSAFFNQSYNVVKWIRRFNPHTSYNSYYGFDGELQTSQAHIHPL